MFSPLIVTFLLVLSALGLLLGVFYYLRSERIVHKRVKSHQWEMAEADSDFRKWLDTEIQTQVNRTKRMGMMFIVLETVWFVLVLAIWLKK